MSDSPTVFTGFGTVTRHVLGRLAKNPAFEVACLAWGYSGWPYDRDQISYDVYPGSMQSFAQDSVLTVLESFRPDVFVSFGDLWMIDWTKDLPGRDRFRSVLYFPIDGEPFPPAWVPVIAAADVAVTYSEYGRRVTQEACPEVSVEMIYHGVDSAVFRPLEDREEVKARHRLEGKFVVGCVARNQPRKHLPILIKAFAKFCRDKPDAMLYLHSDPEDVGWDLVGLVKRYGIEDRTCFSRFASVAQGESDPRLNEVYNLFDVKVLPSAGEGFGLPILEAMAAGVPVLATGYSSCVELVEGRGQLVDVQTFLTIGRFNLEQAVPDIEDLIRKLELLYANPALRAEHGRAGREFAESLDWERLMPQWEALLVRTAQGARPDT